MPEPAPVMQELAKCAAGWWRRRVEALGSSVVHHRHPQEEQWASNRFADMSSSHRVWVN